MKPEEFEDKMRELASKCDDDREIAHAEMDDLMCEVLSSLGYAGGVAVFIAASKWYA